MLMKKEPGKIHQMGEGVDALPVCNNSIDILYIFDIIYVYIFPISNLFIQNKNI